MKRKLLTTFEASQKHGLSPGYIRILLRKGIVVGHEAKISPDRSVWLIEEPSLKRYLSKDRTPGPKRSK